jgi:putative methionine-R-sulfoxide reductase with GAF domain
LSSYSSLDLAFFQQLLANAFTVQECGMDRQSLASIVDLQRTVREGQLGEQGAMQLIAERARAVAYASGVAIGLLNRDHLFYAAGTGTAVSYVGMRVKATLSVSRMSDTRAEILRVENAEVDQRIEAAVCRQFRAKSLLILPVFRGQALAGVLHVLFDEPHVFEDQEMRTYRILAGLLSEALFQSVSPEQQKVASTRMNAARALIEQKVATTERRPTVDEVRAEAEAVVPISMKADPVGEDAQPQLVKTVENEDPVTTEDAVLLPTTSSIWQRYRPLFQRARIAELAVAAVVAAFAWVLCTQKPATGASAALTPKTPVAIPQPPNAPKVDSPNDATTKPAAAASVADAPMPRDLAPAVTRWKVAPERRVKRFGDDVTVRYFPPRTATVLTADGVETRQLSDDVTVRYIRPRNAVVKRDVDGNAPAVQ